MKRLMFVAGLLAVLLSVAPSYAEEPEGAMLAVEISGDTRVVWEQKKLYEYFVRLFSYPNMAILRRGETQEIGLIAEVDRSTMLTSDYVFVSGAVCVENTGFTSTENLSIVLVISVDGAGSYLFPLDLTINPILDPNERNCYTFSEIQPLKGQLYSLTVRASVDGQENVTDHMDLLRPRFPTVEEFYQEANVTGSVDCPQGLMCDVTEPWPMLVSGRTSIPYTMYITNRSAPLDTLYKVTSTVVITSTAANWPQLPEIRSRGESVITVVSLPYRIFVPYVFGRP